MKHLAVSFDRLGSVVASIAPLALISSLFLLEVHPASTPDTAEPLCGTIIAAWPAGSEVLYSREALFRPGTDRSAAGPKKKRESGLINNYHLGVGLDNKANRRENEGPLPLFLPSRVEWRQRQDEATA